MPPAFPQVKTIIIEIEIYTLAYVQNILEIYEVFKARSLVRLTENLEAYNFQYGIETD